jgi:hypothetical protein
MPVPRYTPSAISPDLKADLLLLRNAMQRVEKECEPGAVHENRNSTQVEIDRLLVCPHDELLLLLQRISQKVDLLEQSSDHEYQ